MFSYFNRSIASVLSTAFEPNGQPGGIGLLHTAARPFILLFLAPSFGCALSVRHFWCKMATPGKAMEEIDPLAPQREAALFYGLFLRGHSADVLRRDIDVPRKLLDKMLLRHRNEIRMKARLQSIYQYRKQVLAIFDELVTRERIKERVH
jgi:hypothetical protein